MSIYDNNKELLSTLGVEGNYSTDFEVRKAILNALGGDASMCNSIYEVDLQILKIYQEGGGGTGGTVKVLDGMKFGSSTVLPESLDTSDVTDFSSMFRSCDNLTTIPQLDTSLGTNFYGMFYGCTNLTNIPLIDTSKSTNFSFMFYSCTNLTTIPQLDTSFGTNFNNMFDDCRNLTTIPQLDTSLGTNFNNMFDDCRNLTTIPQLDTSLGTNFKYMFGSCRKLTTIPQLDTSKGTSFGNMFDYCNALENITFIGSINYNISFGDCRSLTYESVKSILTACSNTTNTNSKTVTFKRTLTDQNSELVDLIATCNSKGWTISGLTLQ